MQPLYCGFFTRGTPYQREAVECIETLDRFGLEHEFVGIEPRGSWCRNCAAKPEVIRQMMVKHDGRPIVYLDVDARVRAYPSLFDELDCDFAAHWRNGTELLSGTLWFNSTAAARMLIDRWCEMQQKSPDEWDQIVLERIAYGAQFFRQVPLPPSYTRIFDDDKMGEPVILHTQASRRHKVAVS